MKENNKFIARGITKENKFVYGYPLFNGKKWFLYIFERYKLPLKELKYEGKAVITEIIKAPDRCLQIKDRNGKMLYEDDIAKSNNKYHKFIIKFGKYNTNGKHTANSENFGFYLENISKEFKDKQDFSIHNLDDVCCYYPRYCVDNEKYAIESFGLEVIGNTHNIEVKNDR